MHRRSFLAAAAATAAALALPRGATAEILDYSEGLVRERLAAGETVLVDFSATWCSTCRAQGRAIDGLRAENPAYDSAITFVKVDWDTIKDSMLAAELGVARRSTLIVLRGDEELGRIVADTSPDSIKALLDTGLAAS